MLEGLDQVDWSKLDHAYGPAVDVPDQIRSLSSEDSEQRRVAIWHLFGNIFHQGTRFEATAYAVPFLLELLANNQIKNREAILELLARIAIGYDDECLPGNFPIEKLRRAVKEEAERLAAISSPHERIPLNQLDAFEVAAYDAVQAGIPLFRSLLNDHDPKVRTQAAYLLAWFPENADASLAALNNTIHAHPEDEVTVATSLVAIGLLGGAAPLHFLTNEQPLVQWGAAIASARAQGKGHEQSVVNELLKWAGSVNGHDNRVPYNDEGHIGSYARISFDSSCHTDAYLDVLMQNISLISHPSHWEIIDEALRLTFPNKAPSSFATLDERQQNLVRALVSSSIWEIDSYFSTLMGKYGLPHTQQALQEYVLRPH